MTNKTIEQQYQVLDEIAHIRKRVGMYAGSPSLETRQEYVYRDNKMVLEEVQFVPALIKIISEIIDNSVDEHIRDPKKLDTLKVDFQLNTISIFDNGGIPVVKHKEFDQYVPEIIFGMLRSGSNYNDHEDQSTIGTNGLGSKLSCILSNQFIVETADGSKSFHQEFSNGMRDKSVPKIKKSEQHYTRITFEPDYEFFKLTELDEFHKNKIIKRLVDVAGCNPNLKVYVNGTHLKIKSFQDYVALYDAEYVYDENDKWKVGVTHSDGSQQVSFVNGVETYMGGTHVEYVTNQVVNEIREYFKKKKKIDVKPSDIRTHMRFFISASINRPKFSSQTKENMVSTVSEFKSAWVPSEKFIQKIVKSPIIQAVLDWIEAKERAAEMAELRKLNKNLDKGNPKRVEKFHDATSPDRSKTSLYLVEGDCLEENTEIVVFKTDGFQSVKIKDIKVDDKILTHLGNIKPVTVTQHRIKTSITINTSIGSIVSSKEHTHFVYNTNTNKFEFIEAQNIDKTVHKLVKSKLIDYDYCAKIKQIKHTNDKKYKLTIIVDNVGQNEEIKSSLSHKFGVFNLSKQCYEMVQAQDLDTKTHVFLLKYL